MSNHQQAIEEYFLEFQARVEKVQGLLGEVVGNVVINDALDNFRNESFDNVKWQARVNKKNTRHLLIKSGTLRRSIRIISTTMTSVVVGSDIPYAAVHNYGEEINRYARTETFVRNRYKVGPKGKMFGGMGAFKKGTSTGRGLSFRAYSYNMPKRTFLGLTAKLENKIKQAIDEQFKNEFG
ncbi:phage virion morphogenesis protein [Pedobacter sp.]|uniref:phage virion morphogenesis protein n=1 Tax=Pedobacter sp. TaxID=1411316 RepID=UPI00396CA958